MKRCLMILPRPIFPLVSGYSNKNYHLVQILANRYRLQVVVLTENRLTREELQFYAAQQVACTVWKRTRRRSVFGALCSLLRGHSLQTGYYFDRRLEKRVRELAEQSEVCIASLIRTWHYLEALPPDPDKTLVFDMVDSIALNYEGSRRRAASVLWRWIYTVESKRLMREEQHAIEHSSVTYLFNEAEYRYWLPRGNVRLLPHGVPEQLFSYTKRDRRFQASVAFIGKMDYQPNVDAILWYLREIHTKIGGMLRLLIVGAGPTREVKALAGKLGNVTVTGFVEDPYLYLNSALAVIAPMQTGGGIQNKVLEGMALGKVNVVTSLAAKPIVGAADRQHLLIADSPEAFIRILSDIRDHPNRYHAIGLHARELIRKRYTWEHYGRLYIEGIEESQ